MSEVIEKKLSDIGCEFISGFGFKSSDYTNSGIPLIKIGNIQNRIVSVDVNGTYVSENIINEKIKQVFLSNNDVLIAMTGQGSVGRVGRLKLRNNDKALLNQRVGRFVCDEKNINIDYLYYILTSYKYQDYLFNTGAGSGQPNLSPALILQTEIPWFNYDVQKAIAEVLSSLDDKIDLLHRQNKTLEQMAETLFRQWFVEEAKEDWKEVELSKIAQFKNGKSRPKEEGDFPIYGGNGILGYTNEFNAEDESIIIGRVGAYCGSLYFENQKIWISDNAILCKAKIEIYLYFIFYYLKDLNLNNLAEGSSHPLLTQTLLNKIQVQLPPDNILEQFNIQIEYFFRQLESNKNQINTLEKMRDTLLPKLMSGEVMVKN